MRNAVARTRALRPDPNPDEFQDTNALQLMLLRLLMPSERDASITVVGDDDQGGRHHGSTACVPLRRNLTFHLPPSQASTPSKARVAPLSPSRSPFLIVRCADHLIRPPHIAPCRCPLIVPTAAVKSSVALLPLAPMSSMASTLTLTISPGRHPGPELPLDLDHRRRLLRAHLSQRYANGQDGLHDQPGRRKARARDVPHSARRG